MFIYVLSSLLSLAKEPINTNFIGNWGSVGECGYQYTEFKSDGTLTIYRRDRKTKRYIAEGTLDWWGVGEHIMVGFQFPEEDIIGFDIQSPSFAFQLFSGTMVFPDNSSAEFVWERCD